MIESAPVEVRYDSLGQAYKKVGERQVKLEADATGIGVKGDTVTVDDWKLVPEMSIDPSTRKLRSDLNRTKPIQL
jgi:hypothetical protein